MKVEPVIYAMVYGRKGLITFSSGTSEKLGPKSKTHKVSPVFGLAGPVKDPVEESQAGSALKTSGTAEVIVGDGYERRNEPGLPKDDVVLVSRSRSLSSSSSADQNASVRRQSGLLRRLCPKAPRFRCPDDRRYQRWPGS